MPNERPLIISDIRTCVRCGKHSYLCEISAKLSFHISSVEFGAAVVLTHTCTLPTSSPVCKPLPFIRGGRPHAVKLVIVDWFVL